jgi:hypothetical protein
MLDYGLVWWLAASRIARIRALVTHPWSVCMQSPELLESYRRMTSAQRLKLTLQMIRENTPFLLRGSPEVVGRRFELLRRENDERNQNMLTAIARTKNAP